MLASSNDYNEEVYMAKQHNPDQWQAIIKQWQASGLSSAAFCQQHDVVYS